MQFFKYCILGAGPSGLSFAATLKNRGVNSFLILEKEPTAGGLCRSTIVDGSPLDIGGGHFLDTSRANVIKFLFNYMPRDEWFKYKRISTIRIRNIEVEHPLEGHLWQFPLKDQIDFLESIAQSGSTQGKPEPTNFDSWIRWKLGDLISNEYMLPYNRKIWSLSLNQLGTYWLNKLPSVSFRETLQSCLEKKSGGTLPAHGQFFYPKVYGYGEVWNRIASSLQDHLIPNYNITSINTEKNIINNQIRADTIVTTIPWTYWISVANLPDQIANAINFLRYIGVNIDYKSQNLQSDSHWIYVPNEDLSYHRILLRHNFCRDSHGYWTETNTVRSGPSEGPRFTNHYAYPVNDLHKQKNISKILEWGHSKNIIGLGRWGTWEHLNSDIAVELAIKLAKRELL